MENVSLTVHLILALCLIGVVLLQRSEGGMGSMGGGGGGGGVMTGRAAATAMAKMTWILAIAFICTSIALTILAAADAGSSSVVDRIVEQPGSDGAPAGEGALPSGEDLLSPGGSGDADAPLVPQAAD